MKGNIGLFYVFCMVLCLEEVGMIGAGQETLHQRCVLGVNGEDLDQRVINREGGMAVFLVVCMLVRFGEVGVG